MIKDMTQGKIAGTLWRFSLPLLVSMMFQQLYQIADSAIAGRYCGENALAAVGNSNEVTLIFMAFAIGCNMGSSVVISQLFGAKRYREVKTAVGTTFLASLTLAVVLTVAGLFVSPQLLRLMQTPDQIFSDTMVYLNIYIYGIFFLFLYNISTGVFSALGDSRTPLYFLIGSSVVNIVLDVLFVSTFQMGVAGVAWATFLAQGGSGILSFLTLLRRLRSIPSEGKTRWFSLPLLWQVTRVSVPGILQQSFVSVGNLFTQTLINGYGPGVIAGYSSAIKLNNFASLSLVAFASGYSTFAAQNIGAGRFDRVRRGYRIGIGMAAVMAVPFIAAFQLFAEPLLRIFLQNPSTDALSAGSLFLRMVPPGFLILIIKLMSDNVLKGAGEMRCFMVTTCLDLVLRVSLAYLLSGPFGLYGIWASWPAGWLIGAVVAVLFYRSGIWERSRLAQWSIQNAPAQPGGEPGAGDAAQSAPERETAAAGSGAQE